MFSLLQRTSTRPVSTDNRVSALCSHVLILRMREMSVRSLCRREALTRPCGGLHLIRDARPWQIAFKTKADVSVVPQTCRNDGVAKIKAGTKAR